jgi:hypothetical protein
MTIKSWIDVADQCLIGQRLTRCAALPEKYLYLKPAIAVWWHFCLISLLSSATVFVFSMRLQWNRAFTPVDDTKSTVVCCVAIDRFTRPSPPLHARLRGVMLQS